MQAGTMYKEQKERSIHKRSPLWTVWFSKQASWTLTLEIMDVFNKKNKIKKKPPADPNVPSFLWNTSQGGRDLPATYCYKFESVILTNMYHGNHSVCQKTSVSVYAYASFNIHQANVWLLKSTLLLNKQFKVAFTSVAWMIDTSFKYLILSMSNSN